MPAIGAVTCLVLIAPVGEELKLAAEGADVGADGVKLCVPRVLPVRYRLHAVERFPWPGLRAAG